MSDDGLIFRLREIAAENGYEFTPAELAEVLELTMDEFEGAKDEGKN